MELSGQEILLILFVILIFFGSKSIPDIARMMGKGVREFRNATSDIRKEIDNYTSDIKKEVNDVKDSVTKETKDITDEFKNTKL
ncbi:MAG TPA: twin-arginine translocase TatA/TatE family subunit [Prolixibacteraceae bacterium]|nr:twin-arginine translocase TatA/TatE family subunit [Prolixibacteraceae bacterium]